MYTFVIVGEGVKKVGFGESTHLKKRFIIPTKPMFSVWTMKTHLVAT